MTRRFRLNKKERKRWLKSAKRATILAEQFEKEGIMLEFAAGSRRTAEILTRIARAKRRKRKSRNSK
jgi:hypothetical protein